MNTAMLKPNAARPDRPIVLLVDDTPANLAYLSDALDEAGYKVLVAIDGHTAIERLRLVRPDVILLDVMMPGIDGFETCRGIKESATTRDIPVIFMTGLVDTQHVVEGFGAGAVDYLVKPVRQEEVVARIGVHIERSRSLLKSQYSMEACGRAGVTVDRHGRITWQTSLAQQWLADYCGGESRAQNLLRLREWLKSADERGTAAQTTMTPLTFGCEDNRLSIHFAGHIGNGDYLLLLEEQRAEYSAKRMCELWSLTPREAEVLGWLAGGKTNRDIAEILGMSPRTVNKHLEHIYVKLGVETRAAAVALALKSAATEVRPLLN